MQLKLAAFRVPLLILIDYFLICCLDRGVIAANANLIVVIVIVDGPMSGDCDRHRFTVMRGSIFCLFHRVLRRLAVHLEFL